jgi:hypothetical protein
MLSLNFEGVAALRDAFRRSAPAQAERCFFRTFVLECSKEAPLSWSITRHDLEMIAGSLRDDTVQGHIRQLVDFLTDGAPRTKDGGAPR